MSTDSFKDQFTNRASRPLIPQNVYRPAKRCPNCGSVYLNDFKCEACGRSLSYHPVGEPFGPKSLYGLKERFYHSLPLWVRLFPVFENKRDLGAQSYVRHLNKRLDALLSALALDSLPEPSNRRLFFVELMELIDELLRYGESAQVLQGKIEEEFGFENVLMTPELLAYLQESASQFETKHEQHWSQVILNHRLWGFLRIEVALKFLIISAAAITAAVFFYDVIRSQFGK